MKGTAFSVCLRTKVPSSVPKGRLNLAQDVSPGNTPTIRLVPEGRLKRLGTDSAVPPGLGISPYYPRTNVPGLEFLHFSEVRCREICGTCDAFDGHNVWLCIRAR